MSSENTSKILDKVRKLLSLASNNPNQNEATSAAEMVKRLLIEHNLSLTDVELKEIIKKEVVLESLIISGWMSLLAIRIAEVFDCYVYLSTKEETNKKTIIFIGTMADAEIAYYVYNYFVNVITRLSTDYVKKNKGVAHGHSVRTSYAMGFVSVLKDRLIDFYKRENKKVEDVVNPVTGKTGKEIIVIKKDAVAKWIKDNTLNFGKKEVKHNPNSDVQSYINGQKDGTEITLTHGIKSG